MIIKTTTQKKKSFPHLAAIVATHPPSDSAGPRGQPARRATRPCKLRPLQLPRQNKPRHSFIDGTFPDHKMNADNLPRQARDKRNQDN